MLSVSLILLYVLLTAYLVGFLVLKSISRFCTGRKGQEAPEAFWRNLKADSYIMAGLISLTVYAQIDKRKMPIICYVIFLICLWYFKRVHSL